LGRSRFRLYLSRIKTTRASLTGHAARKAASELTKFEEFPDRIVHSYVINMTLMRTLLPLALFLTLGITSSFAQEPVLIAGGSSPATPVAAQAQPVQAAPIAYALPVVYAAQPGCASGVQVVSGGYYNPGNVVYIGGPNSYYKNVHQGDSFQRGCYFNSPNVIYFGRGEAVERGYAFRHHR